MKIPKELELENAKILEVKHGLCTCCMETHDKFRVLLKEKVTKRDSDEKVEIEAEYWYCDNAKGYYMTEEQMSRNHKVFLKARNGEETIKGE